MRSLTQQFTDWVRTKPARQRYDFTDFENCALSQFGREMGFAHLVGLDDPSKIIPAPLYEAINPEGTPAEEDDDGTFGALSERLSRLSPNPTGRG